MLRIAQSLGDALGGARSVELAEIAPIFIPSDAAVSGRHFDSRIFSDSILFVLLRLRHFFDRDGTGLLLILALSEEFAVNLIMDELVVERVRADVSTAAQARTDLEWKRIRAAIQRAIAPYAGAHEAVVRALAGLCPEYELDCET